MVGYEGLDEIEEVVFVVDIKVSAVEAVLDEVSIESKLGEYEFGVVDAVGVLVEITVCEVESRRVGGADRAGSDGGKPVCEGEGCSDLVDAVRDASLVGVGKEEGSPCPGCERGLHLHLEASAFAFGDGSSEVTPE